MNPLVLTEIWIYPIKSMGGVSLLSSPVKAKGLEYDRRYMLVDAQGVFMTQRKVPSLALFKPTMTTSGFLISFKAGSITLPFAPEQSTQGLEVSIWDDRVMAFEVSDKVSKWFSERLKTTCKLVYFPEENTREVDRQYAGNGEQVSLADGYPFLIIGQSSLDALNSRMTETVPMNRFRPNFVFTGGESFEEDGWKDFMIGKNRFTGVKPCGRCVLTTIDQDTARQGTEPLHTLSKFRKSGNSVQFGLNLVAVDFLEVNVGEKISTGSFPGAATAYL